LSPDKEAVYSEIIRVLKPGGEMYISDVFSDRRIPESLRKDPVLYGECLSGALYIEDFRRILQTCNIWDYRTVSKRKLTIGDDEVAKKMGDIRCYSMTIRAFKLPLEDVCENYGQTVEYKGTAELPSQFILDNHHTFKANEPLQVCGNTFDMIKNTRYTPHFKVVGDKTTHHGLFKAEIKSGCC
ncbi:MAG: methyltransferase type 11, partial [Candidatus Margulisbacteria bacterium]|nr:methyltransferase type 11 [Candidatus Margulisiibacteriota bacterium]